MDNLLFYDTETTGLPLWKEPSGHPGQPHICQLAAVLTNQAGRQIHAMDVLIRPDGWVIPDDMVEFHGITTERALDEGIDIKVALNVLFELWGQCDKRVGAQEPHDARQVRIAIKRDMTDDAFADKWKDGEKSCVLQMARNICKVPNAKGTGIKMPTLIEAHEYFFPGKGFKAHDAMADVHATMDVYFAMQGEQ